MPLSLESLTLEAAIEAAEASAAWLDREAMLRQPIRSLAAAARTMFRTQARAFWREWEEIEKRKPSLEAASVRASEAAAKDLELAVDLAVDTHEDDLLEPYAAHAVTAVGRGAKATLTQLDLAVTFSFDLDDARTIEYIATQGAKLVSGVSRTTRWRMRHVIQAQLEEGKGIQDIARIIRTRFRQMAERKPQKHLRDRAEMIAINELGQAFEWAGEQVSKDLGRGGIAIEKQWITAGDERVSEGCLANAAAGWIPDNRQFPSGHAHPMRHPACRCATGRRLAQVQ